MKVGILTYHDGFNYGAFYQTYAMQRFLERSGYDCRVINYKNRAFTKNEYQMFLDPRWKQVPHQRISRNMVRIAKLKWAHRRLRLTRRFFTHESLSMCPFDAVVLGSDEIWNWQKDIVGCDLAYFGSGVTADKRVAYGISFGSVNPETFVPDEIREAIRRVDVISVRDENSESILKNVVGVDCEKVLDPAFLTDFRPEASPVREKDFLLVYGFFSEQMQQAIREFAARRNKKIVGVGYYLPWCDVSYDTLSPSQWLGYFAASDAVITTMFHGMIFSLLNQKEFFMFSTPERACKVGNFLNELGLSHRIGKETSDLIHSFGIPISYEQVYKVIDLKRERSERFLLNALEGKQGTGAEYQES